MEKSLLDNLFAVNEKLGKIAEIVNRHDTETFPAMVQDNVEIKNSLFRIESKHNQDYLQYIQANEETIKRLTPLENDYLERLKKKEENRLEIRKIKWSAISMVSLGALIGTYDQILSLIKGFINKLLY